LKALIYLAPLCGSYKTDEGEGNEGLKMHLTKSYMWMCLSLKSMPQKFLFQARTTKNIFNF